MGKARDEAWKGVEMKPVFACAFLAAGATCLVSGTLRAEAGPAAEAGPPPPAKTISLAAVVPGPGAGAAEAGGPDNVAQARLQIAGKVVLATAFAFVIVGVVLIEVDPYALEVGDWGFGSVGVGISALITSSFILGLTRPVHVGDHPWER
jgi:hypothetical protein